MFITVTHFSRSFFRIIKRSYIHRLQLGFVNVFIAPIGFICFNNLNVIHFRRSVRAVELSKCCTKWAANESDFCPFLSRHCRSEKWSPKTIASYLNVHFKEKRHQQQNISSEFMFLITYLNSYKIYFYHTWLFNHIMRCLDLYILFNFIMKVL